MGYEIKQSNGKFEVWEKGYKPLLLEKCDTREQAEKVVKQWEARDDLQDKITDFIDEAIDNFGTILEESEIKGMVSEAAKS